LGAGQSGSPVANYQRIEVGRTDIVTDWLIVAAVFLIAACAVFGVFLLERIAGHLKEIENLTRERLRRRAGY